MRMWLSVKAPRSILVLQKIKESKRLLLGKLRVRFIIAYIERLISEHACFQEMLLHTLYVKKTKQNKIPQWMGCLQSTQWVGQVRVVQEFCLVSYKFPWSSSSETSKQPTKQTNKNNFDDKLKVILRSSSALRLASIDNSS